MQRSQVMELCSWLSDVYAPRLTGSPTSMKAAQWTVAKMKEWGFSNVAIEPWVNKNGFERGWTNDKFYMAVVSARAVPDPRDADRLDARHRGPGQRGGGPRDGDHREPTWRAYKGKLKGKWVLTQEAPDVPAMWQPQATRYTREELAAMELWPAPQAEFGVTPPARASAVAARRRQPARRPGRAGGPPAAPAGAPRQAGLLRRLRRAAAARGSRRAQRRDGRPQRLLQGRGRARHHLDRPARPRRLHHQRQPRGRPGGHGAGRVDRRRTLRAHRPDARQEHPGHHRGRHQEHLLPEPDRRSTSSASCPAPTRPTRS